MTLYSPKKKELNQYQIIYNMRYIALIQSITIIAKEYINFSHINKDEFITNYCTFIR